MSVKILIGDVRERLRGLPEQSVHCVVTSPPYLGLRDYGVEGQIGLEKTPRDYVETLVGVLREVRRVLRKDGTVWINMGDGHAGSWGAQGHRESSTNGKVISRNQIRNHPKRASRTGSIHQEGLKPKDLMMMPARVALALQADGWWLRSEIIWAKPNPMPESITDRPTSSHEKIYLLARSERYYFDAAAVREDDKGTDHARSVLHKPEPSGGIMPPHSGIRRSEGRNGGGRNLRNVWTIATAPFPGAHFATFPPALIEPCIKAGTSEKGCCPECGAPWVRQLEKQFIRSGGARGNITGQSNMEGWEGVPRGSTNCKTIGWRPPCPCYDILYRRDFPKARRARKRQQRDAWGDWWRRARSRPGRDAWPVERCLVLDPFGGAGTTGLVADRLKRDAVLIELNPGYAAMARERIQGDGGLFAEVAMGRGAGVGG